MIYNLKLIKSKILKIYIITNLINNFIYLLKYFIIILNLFIQKLKIFF